MKAFIKRRWPDIVAGFVTGLGMQAVIYWFTVL